MRDLLIMILLLASGKAHAYCFAEAAQKYNVPESLIKTIAIAESGMNPAAININSDGSKDIGMMQINSSWLPRLATFGINHKNLQNPCVNVKVGAWILSDLIKRHGWNWEAIGYYNAISPEKRELFVERVWPIYADITKQSGSD